MVSNIFYFHPCLGKIPILTNIFQMGWNHQLDNIYTSSFSSHKAWTYRMFFPLPSQISIHFFFVLLLPFDQDMAHHQGLCHKLIGARVTFFWWWSDFLRTRVVQSNFKLLYKCNTRKNWETLSIRHMLDITSMAPTIIFSDEFGLVIWDLFGWCFFKTWHHSKPLLNQT